MSYTPLEQKLLEFHTRAFMAMKIPSTQAGDMATSLLDRCIKESKNEGTYYLPENLGDIILGNAKSDDTAINKIAEKLRQNLHNKRAEGVQNKDIQWGWNLNDIERRMMLAIDDINKTYLAESFVNQGMSKKEAVEKVRKYQPFYGNPEDDTHISGADRLLPYELKDKINKYVEKRYKSDRENYKKDLENASTFNALVRKEIKKGKL